MFVKLEHAISITNQAFLINYHVHRGDGGRGHGRGHGRDHGDLPYRLRSQSFQF